LPHTDTGERVTPVLDFPFHDGLTVQAVRVDYEPASLIAFFVLGEDESATVPET
jgi:hypothetical protein